MAYAAQAPLPVTDSNPSFTQQEVDDAVACATRKCAMRGLVAFLIDKKCENADAFNHLCDVFNNAMKHNSNEVGILVGDLFGGHRDLATRFDESMFTSKTDQKTRDYIAEVVLNKAAFYNTMDMIGSGETVTDHERNTVAKKLHKNDLVTISCAQSDDQYTISLDDLVLAQYVDKLQERHSPRLYRKIMKVVRHQVRRENEAKLEQTIVSAVLGANSAS